MSVAFLVLGTLFGAATFALTLRVLVVSRRFRALKDERASRELAAIEAQRLSATAAKHLQRERDDARLRLRESEDRWRAVWRAPVGLALMDDSGRVTDANAEAAKLGVVRGLSLPQRGEWTTPTGATVAGARLTWRDAEGDPRSLALLTDATRLHANERERAEAEERALKLEETAFEGIAILDAGVIVDCNATFARMLGVLPHEVTGMRVADLGLDVPRGAMPVAATLAGHPIEALARDARLHGKDARILSVRDVAPLRHAEAEARRLRALAHDTLLALREEMIPVKDPERMERILKTLEDAARVHDGTAVAVDMNEIADGALRDVRAPGIRVHKEFLSNAPALADRVEVSEVLAALVRHACDAMAEQGSGDLTVLTIDTPERVIVEVTDTAPAARAHAPEWGGVPHHLTTGHAILDARGGKLSFTALPGTGATFRLEIPLAPVAGGENH